MDDLTPNRFEPPLTLQQIYFSFAGRIPRKVYWLHGVGGLIVAALVLTMALDLLGVREKNKLELWVNLLLLWPALAISIKRWHDRDKSGWWCLINLLPFIGFLWALVENGFLRGTNGPNRFGEDPTGRF